MKYLISVLILALLIVLGLNTYHEYKKKLYNEQVLNSNNAKAVHLFNQSEVETNED